MSLVFTIGFTQWRASDFFKVLKTHGVQQLIDVRLNNTSQLSGFAKRDDLAFFLQELAGIQYHHALLLAPTPEMRAIYLNDKNWEQYAAAYFALVAERQIEKVVLPMLTQAKTVLLCSEHEPAKCHRRLAVEYLAQFATLDAIHLT